MSIYRYQISGQICHVTDSFILSKTAEPVIQPYGNLPSVRLHEILCKIGTALSECLDEELEKECAIVGYMYFIKNVNCRMFICNRECTLEEAQTAFLSRLDTSGDANGAIFHVGYSEFTLTDAYCNTLKIGNHDIASILLGYIGKHVHMIIDYEKEDS